MTLPNPSFFRPRTVAPAPASADELLERITRVDEAAAAVLIAECYASMYAKLTRGPAPLYHRNSDRIVPFIRLYRLLKLNDVLHEFAFFLQVQFDGADPTKPPFPNQVVGRVAFEKYRKAREKLNKGRAAIGFAKGRDTSVDSRFRPGLEASHAMFQRMQNTGVDKNFAFGFLAHEFDPIYIVLDPDTWPTLEREPGRLGPRVEEAYRRLAADATLRAQLQALREEICI